MQYDVVFEGGGAKGGTFVGAWREFEARECTADRFVGSSAGAIAAAILGSGADAAGLESALCERMPDGNMRLSTFTDIPQQFKDDVINSSVTYELLRNAPIPFVPQFVQNTMAKFTVRQLMRIPLYRTLFSFVEKGGLYSGDTFLQWIVETLAKQQDEFALASFERFYDITGNDVNIVVTDTTAREMLVLNRRTAPDCPVSYATRMSMSIPFLWQEIKWENSWGTYKGKNITGNVLVDGGVLSNFPIDLVVSNDKQVQDVMGPQTQTPPLGFLIDESIPVPIERTSTPQNNEGILNAIKEAKTLQRIEDLVNTSIDARDKMVIQAYWDVIIRLPAKGYKAVDFNMSEQDLKALINAAQNATKQYLDTHDYPSAA